MVLNFGSIVYAIFGGLLGYLGVALCSFAAGFALSRYWKSWG